MIEHKPMAGFLEDRLTDPPCYYSILQDKYVHQDPLTKEWVSLSGKHHDDYLIEKLGLCNRIEGSLNSEEPVLSDVTWSKYQTRTRHSVEAAFDIDGFLEGEIILDSKKYLNTGGTTLPVPVTGEFPETREFLKRSFEDRKDALVFQSTIGDYHQDVLSLRTSPKFPFLILGQSRIEGALFHDVLAIFLGGKSCNFLSDSSDNKKLLQNIFWRIDQPLPRSQASAKVVFLDRFLSKNEVCLRARQETLSLSFFAQKSVFLKTDSRDLMDIQLFNTEYNVHVLSLSPLKGYRPDFEALKRELPHFMAYLTGEFKLPDSLTGKYIAPEIDELLFGFSTTGQFWSWLKGELISNGVEQATQSLADLRTLYSSLPMGDMLRVLLKKDGVNFPTYMEEICQRFPESVKEAGENNWKFNLT